MDDMTIGTTTVRPDPAQLTEDDMNLLRSTRARFADIVGADDGRGAVLFETDTHDLWETFLGVIPPDLRAIYACNACRKFVERYGGLVAIDGAGFQRSVMWNDGPGVFRDAVRVLAERVEKARITGVFISSEAQWGTPVTGVWQHFSVTPPPAMVWRDRVKTAGQRRAELSEEYGVLRRSLVEYPVEIVRNAHNLLTTGHLFRSEKCIGVAAWLLELHEELAKINNRPRNEAIVWRAAATAPPGFCHVKTTVISTLLDDLVAGMEFSQIKSRFDSKMHPLQYQRPQTAPASGNIKQAEKIVEQLGIAPSLKRRFATLDEVAALWRPKPVPEAEAPAGGGGVFDHLKPKGEQPRKVVEAPPILMTWEKFAATVMPDAEGMELLVATGRRAYTALVTAADPEAPPILQWDREDRRNPFSLYMFVNGSMPDAWNLLPRSFVRVTAITSFPWHWYGSQNQHHGAGVVLLLEGARDLAYVASGGFFVESLRNELHSVRATLEAYAKDAVVAGAAEATACGLALSKGAGLFDAVVRVTTKSGRASYKLDRWE